MFFRLGEVLLVIAAMEQSAVDLRVERLDATVEKLGCAGELRDVDDRQAGIPQGLGGAAGGEEFHPHVVQVLGEFGEAGFIGDGEKSAGDGHGNLGVETAWRCAGRQARRNQAGRAGQAE